MTITGNFVFKKYFHYSNFETIFLKNKNTFRKLKYRYLVESTTVENATFPNKTVLSKENFKTNRMVSTIWTYRNNRISKIFVVIIILSVSLPYVKSNFNRFSEVSLGLKILRFFGFC